MLTFAVVGMGARGRKYTDLLLKKGVQLTAVCDKDPMILKYSEKTYGLPENRLFLTYEQFFKNGKLADWLIISTSDAEHIKSALPALEIGYDLLLEKPIATTLQDCEMIDKKAKEYQRRVVICHVLRYSPFYQTIKQAIDSKEYGKIVHINQIENVGYWHQAHSFVRGNWRNEKESTFMILAKCCHDLDMIAYLTNKRCEYVSSMGELSYFTSKNAPEGSTMYCVDCPLKDCPYHALNWYSKHPLWVKLPELPSENQEEFIRAWASLKDNPYARCVFMCDNDVVDHQIVNMQFEDHSTANLTMVAFSNQFYRQTHVYLTKGEIYGNMLEKKIYCTRFGQMTKTIDLTEQFQDAHGGGDTGLIDDLYDIMCGKQRNSRTNIEASMISHKIAFAAEKSRLNLGKLQKIDYED